MLNINKEYIRKNGGFLHAVNLKSAEYIGDILGQCNRTKSGIKNIAKLDRTISHKNPHLDEYFADLLFRSVLPKHKRNIDFLEMSIYSEDNDSGCKAYWPNAAVFGIGGLVSGGAKPIISFDEHEKGGEKTVFSSSQMVINSFAKGFLPKSIRQIINEVNKIDAFGGAHPLHIGNIIKTGHFVQFTFQKSEVQYKNIMGCLSPKWKKSLMDVSMTSVLYALENDIPINEPSKEMSNIILKSLDKFMEGSLSKDDQSFQTIITTIKSNVLNLKSSFNIAKLSPQKKTPQLFLISKICFALYKAWPEDIADIVMMHFWQILYHGQQSFIELYDICKDLKTNQTLPCPYGEIIKKEIQNFSITPQDNKFSKNKEKPKTLWIIHCDQTPRLVMGNRPLMNYINKYNMGFGIVILRNKFGCTQAIFKGIGIEYSVWKKLVDTICKTENGYWHKVLSGGSGKYAPFLINGTPSHQYVPFSNIDIQEVENILKHIN
ncbi:MAG: hypothetical protein ACPGSD_17200 [Flavobacteriales bacterium]